MNGEEIGRHKEWKDRGIIAWPEHGADQSNGINRISIPFEWHAIGCPVRHSLKLVWHLAVLSLLLAECPHGEPDRFDPQTIKACSIIGGFPIFVRESNGITKRIDLPFAFMNSRFHLGAICFLPFAHSRTILVK